MAKGAAHMDMTNKTVWQVLIGLSVVSVVALPGCSDVLRMVGGPKVVEFDAKVGHVIITDREEKGPSHLKIECNNGLVVDADWKRNAGSEFGYDIYEPEVNKTYNRLAVMLIARGVIANYLNGKYEH